MDNSVYCIIVTYNALRWIDKCLDSLASSTISVEPVIIDNNSKDDTVNYIKTNYPSVHVIENKINRGFGQANNQGIEYAYSQGASHFFLLNQDAWVEPNAIERLVDIQNRYNLALVSPIHLNGKGDKYDYSYFVKIVVDEVNVDYISDMFNQSLKPYYSVEKINAAAWMLSRKTIEMIGGFDPIYFHYGEDGNYCQRIHYHRGEVVFVPDSIIHHDRERQGNMAVYKKNEVLMWLLFLYTDVNSNFFRLTKDKLKLHTNHFISSIKLLFTCHFREYGQLAGGYIGFIKRLPRVRKSISTNRTIGSNWLNI